MQSNVNNLPLQHYSRVAIILHWSMALFIFVLLGLGWYIDELPKGPERGWFIGVHKSFGILAFGLLSVRVFWRIGHRPPPLPESLPVWQRRLATGVHALLYVFLLVQPLSGYLSASFSGYPMAIFGWQIYNWGWKDPGLNEFLSDIHEASSLLLAGLIAVHIAAALWHVRSSGAVLLRRMLP